jgi:hypothetical protein
MSSSAHSWIEIVIQGLHDLFETASTVEEETLAIEAFAEVRRLTLEAAA